MTGRRQHPRYFLAEPLDGHLHVREEVVVERWEANEIEVLSMSPCRVTERLTLEVPGNSRGRVEVTVTESQPFLTSDGAIRYHVRLSMTSASEEAAVPRGRQAL